MKYEKLHKDLIKLRVKYNEDLNNTIEYSKEFKTAVTIKGEKYWSTNELYESYGCGFLTKKQYLKGCKTFEECDCSKEIESKRNDIRMLDGLIFAVEEEQKKW